MQYMATCYSIIYSDFLTLNIILQCHLTCYQISDCDVLPDILNGSVDLSDGTTYLSTAVYSCDIGHNIVGNNMRTCIDGGLWNETEPSCQKIGKTFHYSCFCNCPSSFCICIIHLNSQNDRGIVSSFISIFIHILYLRKKVQENHSIHEEIVSLALLKQFIGDTKIFHITERMRVTPFPNENSILSMIPEDTDIFAEGNVVHVHK